MTVDDGRDYVDELAIRVASVHAEHVEGRDLVDRVTLHQDALGTLGRGTVVRAEIPSS